MGFWGCVRGGFRWGRGGGKVGWGNCGVWFGGGGVFVGMVRGGCIRGVGFCGVGERCCGGGVNRVGEFGGVVGCLGWWCGGVVDEEGREEFVWVWVGGVGVWCIFC